MNLRRATAAAALIVLGFWFLDGRAKSGLPAEHPDVVPANFVDVTSPAGVQFHHYASQTAKKYMLEIMGSGVAPRHSASSGQALRGGDSNGYFHPVEWVAGPWVLRVNSAKHRALD